MAKKTDVTKSSKKDTGKDQKKAEMKKVVWPTRQQVTKNTGVVLSVMVVMALFLFGVDSGLGAAIKAILKIGG